MNINIYRVAAGTLLAFGAVFLSSCSKDPSKPGLEFMPDMYRSPSYETYSPNDMFSDSLSALEPVEGSIPRGYAFFNYPSSNEGYEAAGRDLTNPFERNEINLEEGKYLYDNFCMHCHGENGGGDGSLIATGKFPPPPSYISGVSSRGGTMSELSDGKIYHTITYGINLMGPHASQLNPEERWKITLYVRELMAQADTSVAVNTASAETPDAN